METMLSGVCEVASWLDWWLSTCGGFRENLPVEVRADFERLILSGSRALEFLASQGSTALGNLVLTVPAEEVACLRYSPLPEMVSIFLSPLLDSASTKMRVAANDTSSTYPSSAQDSSEACGCWRVVDLWFCAGELLWCPSCSEAVFDFIPFWPVWQEEEEPQG